MKQRIIGWLLTPVSRAYLAVLFLLLCGVAALVLVTVKRVGHDERSSCVIQARGLPAGHELAASMADIHVLLTLRPQSKAQKLAAQNTPPAVAAVIKDLNVHLSKYSAAEAKQPSTRSC